MKKIVILILISIPLFLFSQNVVIPNTAISELFFNDIGVHCLAEGTLISMSNITTKTIEDIVVDDLITIYDTNKKWYTDSKVKAIHKASHKKMYRISFQNSDIQLIITDDHPLWTYDGWVSIKPEKTRNYTKYKNKDVNLLKVGDNIVSPNGNLCLATIEKIEYSKLSYSLELEDDYPFIANGILVGQE